MNSSATATRSDDQPAREGQAREPARASVVVGVDGSRSAREALRVAVGEARLRGAGLRVVTAWHMPTMTYGGAGLIPDIDPTGFQESASAVLEAALAALGEQATGVQIERVVRMGQPAQVLVAQARAPICWSSAPVDTAASPVSCSARSAISAPCTPPARSSSCISHTAPPSVSDPMWSGRGGFAPCGRCGRGRCRLGRVTRPVSPRWASRARRG